MFLDGPAAAVVDVHAGRVRADATEQAARTEPLREGGIVLRGYSESKVSGSDWMRTGEMIQRKLLQQANKDKRHIFGRPDAWCPAVTLHVPPTARSSFSPIEPYDIRFAFCCRVPWAICL